MFTLVFWRAAFERALKTGAQFVLMTLGVGVGAGVSDGATADVINAFTLNYVTLAGSFCGGMLVSVMFSLVTAKLTDGNPSLSNAEKLNPRA